MSAPGSDPALSAESVAANTRNAAANAAARQLQAAADAAAAAAAAASPAAVGDEHKAADAAAGNGDAADAGGNDRDSIANMLAEMRRLRDELDATKRAQQQQQPQSQSLSLDASAAQSPQGASTSAEFAKLIRTMQDHQADLMRQQAAAQADMMLKQAAQHSLLQSLGELPTFSGKGADTTLIAHEWLTRAEDLFAAREQALGITAALGDKSRLLNAINALTEDARRWFTALPQRPADWTAFGVAVKARFCSVPSERIRVDKLHEFVEKAARLRENLNLQGMQAFATRFVQLAGEVPDAYVTLHGKIALLVRGLPKRYAEVVLKEDARTPTPPLHEIVNTVLSRAANKEQAASYGGTSSPSGPASAASVAVDAISLASAMFGWTREEAAQHLEDGEGWAPHDTNSQQAPSAAAAFATPSRMDDDQFERFCNAMSARVGAGPAARDHAARNGGSNSRRTVPSGVTQEVPAELANARKEAGLCIKCGIVKYEGGSKGHNSRTCQAPANKTTSAAEGKKKANF